MSKDRPQRFYRETDHTADLRVEIYGRTHHELVLHAVETLYDLLGLPEASEEAAASLPDLEELAFSGTDGEDLLVRLLGELLAAAVVDRRRWVPRKGSCRLTRHHPTGQALRMDGRWLPLPEEATRWKTEIKAVTYHDATIRKCSGGYVATLVMDL